MHAPYWSAAVEHLQADTVLAEIIARYGADCGLVRKSDAYTALMRAIVGQQISVQAATAVNGRVEALLGGAHAAELLLQQSESALRACGLSGQKITYARHLSEAALLGHLDAVHLTGDDAAVIKHLTQLKGIGVWTAEMFLIFHLLRPNVLPLGDLGLRKAIDLCYNNQKPLSDAKTTALAKRWAPYRTVATWYLWRSLDPIPVAY